MIIRIWRGWAAQDRPDDYPAHFRAQVIHELRRVAGFEGADLLRRDDERFIEFTVITRWASFDAIAAFAGDDPERAVVEPGAIDALDHFDAFVTHHRSILHRPD